MKKLLILPLLLVSCATTHSGYEATRTFPVDANSLHMNINYSQEASYGEASETTILGLIKLGPSDFAYGGGGTGLGFASLLGAGNSVDSAAVADVLSKSQADVLGFPLFQKRVTNFFLWKTETVQVKGYPGKVVR